MGDELDPVALIQAAFAETDAITAVMRELVIDALQALTDVAATATAHCEFALATEAMDAADAIREKAIRLVELVTPPDGAQ